MVQVGAEANPPGVLIRLQRDGVGDGDDDGLKFLARLEFLEGLADELPFALDGEGKHGDVRATVARFDKAIGLSTDAVADEGFVEGGEEGVRGDVAELEAELKGVVAGGLDDTVFDGSPETDRGGGEFKRGGFDHSEANHLAESGEVFNGDGRRREKAPRAFGAESRVCSGISGRHGVGLGRLTDPTAGEENPEEAERDCACVAGEE